jgi:hypothetical protein
MTDPVQTIRAEPRWPPALAILAVLALISALPHHVQLTPLWVSYLVVLAVLLPMIAVTLTKVDAFWLKLERRVIMLFAAAYIVNTAAELADMIGIITLHPPETRKVSLLSSSLAIWVTNVLTFALVYWQIDGAGPHARTKGKSAKPDWLFPQGTTTDGGASDWRPMFLDYLFVAYTTATAFSPTDAAPLTHRAKLLMMLESAISLLTLVIVAARAINVIP